MNAVEKWHDIMKNPGSNISEKLDELLDDDVVFYSPVVFTPQKGKDITKLYLAAAGGVFSSDKDKQETKPKESKFKYIKEIVQDNYACLEFETEINGIYVNVKEHDVTSGRARFPGRYWRHGCDNISS